MSGIKHTILVLAAIFLAYLWLEIPALSYYSLQAFALAAISFFVLKRLTKAEIWHILPKTHSPEIALVSFAIVLLIGATGNASSIFYPFAYVHLFFLVMTTRQNTAIIATIATMLVHYALEPALTTANITTLLTLPLMLVFFLFARRQYDDARLQHRLVKEEEKALEDVTRKEHTLESFITEFMQPKLILLEDMLETAIHRDETLDLQTLKTQVSLLESENEKVLAKIRQVDTPTETANQNQEP